MKKSRYTEEQIIGILKQHEAGVKTADLCREHGISAATFYGWKSKFGGMDVSEAQRLKTMEDENRGLKLLVAELSLHGEALKAVIRKNGWRYWKSISALLSKDGGFEFRESFASPNRC
jgi:putative transposase